MKLANRALDRELAGNPRIATTIKLFGQSRRLAQTLRGAESAGERINIFEPRA